MKPTITGLLILAAVSGCLAVDKEGLQTRYRNKFVVAMRDGLAIGVCASRSLEKAMITIQIDGDDAKWKAPGYLLTPTGCGRVDPEPIRKGEVLKVKHIAIRGDRFIIAIENASPHQIERGQGAFQHGSYETGYAFLSFHMDDKNNLDQVSGVIDRWLMPFDSAQEAAKFGNTASGVFVKHISVGMSFAEVESAMGPPQTRVDLPEKILYKYKDMTVEFRDGKVADVR